MTKEMSPDHRKKLPQHGQEFFADFFMLLNVAPDAPHTAVRRHSHHGFRQAARRYHPDFNQDLTPDERAECVRRFLLFGEGYRILGHAATTVAFRAELERTGLPISRDGVTANRGGTVIRLGIELPSDHVLQSELLTTMDAAVMRDEPGAARIGAAYRQVLPAARSLDSWL